MIAETTVPAASVGGPARSWPRFLGIAGVYVVVGPLAAAVGVAGLHAGFSAGAALAQGEVRDLLRLAVGGLVVGSIMATLIAYTLGLVSAVGVGLAVALVERQSGRVSFGVALAATLAFCLLTAVFGARFLPQVEGALWILALFVGHVVAVAVCTPLARRLFGRRG